MGAPFIVVVGCAGVEPSNFFFLGVFFFCTVFSCKEDLFCFGAGRPAVNLFCFWFVFLSLLLLAFFLFLGGNVFSLGTTVAEALPEPLPEPCNATLPIVIRTALVLP